MFEYEPYDRALLDARRTEAALEESWQRLSCALAETAHGAALDALAVGRDSRLLESWFVEALERPLAPGGGGLRFVLAETTWRGRVEGYDLALEPDAPGTRAGSLVLARLGRLASDDPRLAELPLAYAALAAVHLVGRVDPRLLPGGGAGAEVTLHAGERVVDLGRYDGERWS